jgi:hypothetical protein
MRSVPLLRCADLRACSLVGIYFLKLSFVNLTPDIILLLIFRIGYCDSCRDARFSYQALRVVAPIRTYKGKRKC